MINANLPRQLTVLEAASLMRENLMKRSQEEREYIANHFLSHLRQAGITPSETFIQAFEQAAAPFKTGDQS